MLKNLANVYVVGDITSWINNMGQAVLGIVAIVVGISLIVRALWDIRDGIGKATKDWPKAGIGILVGTVGAFIMYWGATNIISFFKDAGNSIPKS